MKRWPQRCAEAAAIALISAPAQAHFQAPGLSDFNAGVLHPLLTVQHAMALVAFGLMCGQGGAVLLRFGLPSLMAGLALGFIAAQSASSNDLAPRLLTGLASVAGLTVAAHYRLPSWLCIAMGLMIGGAVGFDSNPVALTLLAQLAGISGTVVAVLLLFLNVAGLAFFATAEWQRIGIRVIGSWTSAAAFLNIALLFRK